MPDLEQRIRTWTATVAEDVDPVELDEIYELADAGPITDTSAAEPEQRSRRSWLAAAAVVILLAATLATIALIRPGTENDTADTGLSPTIERLIELGPAEFPTEAEWHPFWSPWTDVEAARRAAGLDLPSAPASVDDTLAYFNELYTETGVDPLHMGDFAQDLGEGNSSLDWWEEIGIDPTHITGYVRNDELPEGYAVIVGDFDVDEIDEAVRRGSSADLLDVDDHRGVTTYSWGDDLELLFASNTFPGFRSARMAAIDDQTVLLTHTTADMHDLIDRALDGGRTVADDPAMALLDTVDDAYAFTIVRAVDGPYSAWATFNRIHESGEPQRLVTAQVRSGESAQALARRIEREGDAVLQEFAGTTWPELDGATVVVTVSSDVLIVDVIGLPEVDRNESEEQMSVRAELTEEIHRAIEIIDMSHNPDIHVDDSGTFVGSGSDDE